MRLIHKVLAVHRDLALGKGTVVQQRGLITAEEREIELAFIFRTIDEVKDLDVTRYLRIQIHQPGDATEYWYDEFSNATPDDITVIKPNNIPVSASGRWLLVEILIVYSASALNNPGNTIEQDVNLMDWSGHQYAQGSTLYILQNHLVIFDRDDGKTYLWVGPKPALVGLNGTYTTVADDFLLITSLLHEDLIDVSPDQHHDQSHSHDGSDGSGQIVHSDLLGLNENNHHPKLHDISSHTDVTVTTPLEGQGLWFDVETGNFLNRGPLNEAFPTGLATGGEMNIAPTADDIEVVGPGIALIIDSYTEALAPPAAIGLSWDTFNVPITAALPVAGSVVWISLASSGVPDAPFGGINVFEAEIRQYNTPPTPILARQEVFLGVLVHNGTFWKEVSNPKVINQTAETLREFVITVFGPSYIIQGGGVSELAAFALEQQAGTIWENNRNWHADKSDPNREALPARSPLSFRYVNRDFTDVGTSVTAVDSATWDNAGTVEAIGGPANNATIQRLYMDPADNFWVLWGQTIYPNFLTAQANLPAESLEVPFILQNSILLGYIVVERAKNDWDVDEAVFIAIAGAGGVGGGGTPITDHANLNNILPNDHHMRLVWKGDFIAGPTYIVGDMSIEQGYLGVCNTDTTDPIAPVAVGDPFDPGSGATYVNDVAFITVEIGNHYTMALAGVVFEINFIVPLNNIGLTHTLTTILNGVLTSTTTFIATSVGIIIIPVQGTFLFPGDVFEIHMTATNDQGNTRIEWEDDVGFWSTYSDPMFSDVTGELDGVPDETAYAVSMTIVQATISPDWDILSAPGGSSSGGGDFTPDLFLGAGTSGYVPDPGTEQNFFLRDDGTFADPAEGAGFWAAFGADIINTNTGGGVIIEADGTQIARFDSSQLYVNGKVGIGTDTPQRVLHIQAAEQVVTQFESTNATPNAFLDFVNPVSVAGQVRIGALSGNFIIRTAGTDRLYIEATGNVGIGTTIPRSILNTSISQVNLWPPAGNDLFEGGINDVAALMNDVNNNDVGGYGRIIIGAGSRASSGGAATAWIAAVREGTTTGAVALVLGHRGKIEALRIDSIGNVGIGTDDPNSLLHVEGGNMRMSATGINSQILFYRDGVISGRMYGAADRLQVESTVAHLRLRASDASGYIRFDAGGTTERMRIDSLGNVGIGTVAPSRQFVVESTQAVSALITRPAGSITTLAFMDQNTSSDTQVRFGAEGNDALFIAGSFERMRILGVNGNVGINVAAPERLLHIRRGNGAGAVVDGSTYLLVVDSDTDSIIQLRSPDASSQYIRFSTPSSFGRAALQMNGATGDFIMQSADDLVFNSGGGSESMRIEDGGEVGINTSSPSARLHIISTAATGMILDRSGANVSFYLRRDATNKLRIGTQVSGGIVSAQDGVLILDSATSHVNIRSAATTSMYIRSTGWVGVGSTVVQDGELMYVNGGLACNTFSTLATGVNSFGGPLAVAGSITPTAPTAYHLGGASFPWNNVYSSGGIQPSDRNIKQDIVEFTSAELDVAKALGKLIRRFKYNDAVKLKGFDDARYHVGWMAQDVFDTFESFGLDARKYGMYCEAEHEETGETLYMIKTDELQTFIIAGQEARLEALENG